MNHQERQFILNQLGVETEEKQGRRERAARSWYSLADMAARTNVSLKILAPLPILTQVVLLVVS